MERIISSRKKITVKKEEGWYSETEMKSELKWQPPLVCNLPNLEPLTNQLI